MDQWRADGNSQYRTDGFYNRRVAEMFHISYSILGALIICVKCIKNQ
jgi:hypothetical protein